MEENIEKDLFKGHYSVYYEEKPNKRPYTIIQLNEIANEISTAKTSTNKSRRDYYLLSKYDVVTVNENKSVIKKVQNQGDPLIYLVPEEDIYSTLRDVHINCGHGSRDKIINIVQKKFCIPRPCIEMFLKSCKACQTKKSKTVSKVVVKPITSKHFMARGQVDLIDFQSIADGEFKWLLNYQDHATKYLCLRPLRSKRAVDVAEELLKIFLQFGAPSVLQSDNGREFANSVVEELKTLWPELCIVHGRPRHPQSQGSVERANQDVENMLRAWMLDNKSTAWSRGCNFVQWQKNSSLHRVIGRSPFKAVFGADPKLGLKSTNLPPNIIFSISTEEELEKVETEINAVHENNTNQNEKQIKEVTEIESTVIEVIQEEFDNSQEIRDKVDDIQKIKEQEGVNEDIVVISQSNEYGPLLMMPVNTENDTSEDQIKIVAFEFLDNKQDNDTHKILSCIVCQKEIVNDADRCRICKMPFHSICTNGEPMCNLCCSEASIKIQQDKCFNGQKRQAEQMIAVTKRKLPNIDIGDCVLINIDKVDRSPGDPPNLISVVTDIKNGVYQVGTSGGIIKSWFNRPDLKKATSNFINPNEVNSSKLISIREAVSLESLFKGQGYVKCLCQPSKVQCKTSRCKCFKSKMQCNSRCHKSGPCVNK